MNKNPESGYINQKPSRPERKLRMYLCIIGKNSIGEALISQLAIAIAIKIAIAIAIMHSTWPSASISASAQKRKPSPLLNHVVLKNLGWEASKR